MRSTGRGHGLLPGGFDRNSEERRPNGGLATCGEKGTQGE